MVSEFSTEIQRGHLFYNVCRITRNDNQNVPRINVTREDDGSFYCQSVNLIEVIMNLPTADYFTYITGIASILGFFLQLTDAFPKHREIRKSIFYISIAVISG
ncbi:hypothetical protein Ppro_2499 [Pelobacter propionicus DSM 2379]|uniref:Uncharacterized protein n=1 Tax=Pelobacter propionicus (strain DSM 2379 / NBRC 103807 / OttBd1) TaxID=338966 RepID=A1ARY4_PELPD|nr:hypothetical protein Ppro_2499 [Pelobacter propionicus DSM 2379]